MNKGYLIVTDKPYAQHQQTLADLIGRCCAVLGENTILVYSDMDYETVLGQLHVNGITGHVFALGRAQQV